MAALSLYRKYRSQNFASLVGQDHVVRALQNALTSGRIAHAYLFTGPRGTGKTSTARLLAKALCCENGPRADFDENDPICQSISQGSCVDVIEIDAASESGVQAVRETIVGTVEYQPMVCRYKVFVIDEVHDLSREAFDALLKTIEEPPPHIVFILATTEFNKVPPTIRSRCQKYEFHRASIQDLTKVLERVLEEENAEAEPQAITAIARMADGGFRDALTLLEQAMITAEGKITLEHVIDQLGLVPESLVDELLLSIKERSVPKAVEILDEVARRGRDPRALLESLMYRLADLTRAGYQVSGAGLDDGPREAALHDLSVRLGAETILQLRNSFADAHRLIRDISLPRLWLESEVVRLAGAPPPSKPAAAPIAEAAPLPKRKPEPVSDPKPAKEPVAAPVEEPAATPPPVDAAALDEANWKRTLDALPDGVLHRMKLADSRLLHTTETEFVVGLSRINHKWFHEKEPRMAYIREVFVKTTGDARTLRLEPVAPANVALEPETVELSVEGEELHRLASQKLAPRPENEDPR